MSKIASNYGAINLSQGFPNYSSDPSLFELVKRYMDKGFNQYAPLHGVAELRSSIADKVKKLYDKNTNIEEELCITSGATQAVYTAIQTIIHPGEEAIIFDPSFDIYAPSVKLAGGTVKRIPLEYPEFKIDWDHVKSQISPNTRLIVINFPHNPTGTIITQADITALEEIVTENDIYILSDEVYEHLVFDGQPHLSILANETLYDKSIVTFSFGKTFHNTGWKVGFAVAPKDIMEQFKKVHQFVVFSVNTPVQYALADYMKDEQTYLSLSSSYEAKRDFFLDRLQDSRFKFKPTAGTYFQLLDYAEISAKYDFEFAQELAKDHGVASIPLSPFYEVPPKNKLLRLCFAKTNDILEAATERLCKI